MPKHFNIPIFIPELACPHQCVFCNQQKISGTLKSPDHDEIIRIIEKHLATIDYKNNHVELAFFGGNFTGIPVIEQEAYLNLIQPYIEKGIIQSIRISTRPDYINKEILSLLTQKGVRTIELGAQSMSDDVLIKSGRGHTSAITIEAAKLITEHGFELGLQMMIGLPGDTFEKSFNTAKTIVELKATSTRIYPTLVIKGTKLEELYLQGIYSPLTLQEAIEWTKEIYLFFEKNNVTVLRTGLHPSEGLISGAELVAGPFHQSFKELVMSEIWNTLLMNLKTKDGLEKIIITVNPSEINYAIGYNSTNRKTFEKIFRFVEFKKNDELLGRDFHVDYS